RVARLQGTARCRSSRGPGSTRPSGGGSRSRLLTEAASRGWLSEARLRSSGLWFESMAFIVLFDANVLYSIALTDFFLSVSLETNIFRPHWSTKILDEVGRNLQENRP